LTADGCLERVNFSGGDVLESVRWGGSGCIGRVYRSLVADEFLSLETETYNPAGEEKVVQRERSNPSPSDG